MTLKMRNMRSLTWAGLSFPSSSSRNVCPQGTGSCCSTRDPAISCLNSKSCVCLCPTFYSDYVSSRWNELLFVQHKGKLFTNICRREFCRGDFHWLHIFTLPKYVTSRSCSSVSDGCYSGLRSYLLKSGLC